MKRLLRKFIGSPSASLWLLLSFGTAPGFSQTLDPATIPKYVTPLHIPPAVPLTSTIADPDGEIDYYEVAVRQFDQQILPAGFPATTVFGFGAEEEKGTF